MLCKFIKGESENRTLHIDSIAPGDVLVVEDEDKVYFVVNVKKMKLYSVNDSSVCTVLIKNQLKYIKMYSDFRGMSLWFTDVF